MKRTYTLRRRAEQQAETRRRIVEAAVDLHSDVGPASTTISMIADRAGVQRHTVYAHFPDERSLFLACSARSTERDPLPEAGPWRSIVDRSQRLSVGLTEIYGWYARNAKLAARILRDAEHHALTREMIDLRIEPSIAEYQTVLGEGLGVRGQAMLRLALRFFTWQTLVEGAGLTPEAAVAAMAKAVDCNDSPVRRGAKGAV